MKTKKKIKVVAKNVAKKTRLLISKANIKAGKVVRVIKKEWKKEEPQRKEFEKELKKAVGLAIKNGSKIGADIIKTIKKDISEINHK